MAIYYAMNLERVLCGIVEIILRKNLKSIKADMTLFAYVILKLGMDDGMGKIALTTRSSAL